MIKFDSKYAKIKDYTSKVSRNKIIVHRELFIYIPSIDIGVLLSNKLYGQANANRISMIANSAIDEILNANIFIHEEYGKSIAMKNIGILFEKELKLDFLKILEWFSNSNNLFLQLKQRQRNRKN